jgi:integrase
MNVKHLDYEFVSQFAYWLKTERKCGHNAAMKYLGNLKKIVLECVRKGWLKSDPFIDYKFKRKEVVPIALTKEEITKIAGKKFNIERLDHVRDIFLFSCYTGLAYIDVYKLKPIEIITGIDGCQWIDSKRQKTTTSISLPLLPSALHIMAKYKGYSKCIEKDTVLPVLTK